MAKLVLKKMAQMVVKGNYLISRGIKVDDDGNKIKRNRLYCYEFSKEFKSVFLKNGSYGN